MKYCSNCGAKITTDYPITCSNCGSQFWRNPRCCAGALILDQNKILLVKRAANPWSGHWDIPGGYCEWNEHPEQSAQREALEETGLKVSIHQLHGIWTEPSDQQEHGDTICVYYTAKVEASNVFVPSKDEISQMKWFDLNDLPQNLAFPAHIPAVLESIKVTANDNY